MTARWVFYRLLQDGSLALKADYKRLLGYLSKARKEFYGGWTPYVLADESRAALVRGSGFGDGREWVNAVAEQVNCNLDRWSGQHHYVEVLFEAAAMQSQFQFYANENIPLLAFHGDVSIPEKWKATTRLVRRWHELEIPIVVLYYGDLDPKGISIPQVAQRDVEDFSFSAMYTEFRYRGQEASDAWNRFLDNFQFIRVGLNEEQIQLYDVPENPERPGTYQWEGIDDATAQELIEEAESYIDLDGFDLVMTEEERITDKFRAHVREIDLEEEDSEE